MEITSYAHPILGILAFACLTIGAIPMLSGILISPKLKTIEAGDEHKLAGCLTILAAIPLYVFSYIFQPDYIATSPHTGILLTLQNTNSWLTSPGLIIYFIGVSIFIGTGLLSKNND